MFLLIITQSIFGSISYFVCYLPLIAIYIFCVLSTADSNSYLVWYCWSIKYFVWHLLLIAIFIFGVLSTADSNFIFGVLSTADSNFIFGVLSTADSNFIFGVLSTADSNFIFCVPSTADNNFSNLVQYCWDTWYLKLKPRQLHKCCHWYAGLIKIATCSLQHSFVGVGGVTNIQQKFKKQNAIPFNSLWACLNSLNKLLTIL